MEDQKQGRSKPTKKLSWKLVLAVVVVLVFASQLERLVSKGTFFGYVVRKKQVTKSVNVAKDATNKPSESCNKADAKKVSDVLGTEVVRIGGSFADRKEPTFISVCTYRTKATPSRVVTIVLRDSKDEAAAKQVYAASAKRNGSSAVSGVGSEANFSTVSQQLMARTGRRIVTVTVNKPRDKKQISSKDATVRIAQFVL